MVLPATVRMFHGGARYFTLCSTAYSLPTCTLPVLLTLVPTRERISARPVTSLDILTVYCRQRRSCWQLAPAQAGLVTDLP